MGYGTGPGPETKNERGRGSSLFPVSLKGYFTDKNQFVRGRGEINLSEGVVMSVFRQWLDRHRLIRNLHRHFAVHYCWLCLCPPFTRLQIPDSSNMKQI